MHWLYEWAHGTAAWQKLGFALVMVVFFLAVIGLLLLLIDRTPRKGREKWQAFLFLLPAFILLAVGLIGPIIKTAISSLTSAEQRTAGICVPVAGNDCLANRGGSWNNFAHFRWAFTNHDALFALFHTLEWTLITPAVATLIGLLYAYSIDKIRGEAVAKALVFLPTAISFVGAAVIWNLMYKQPSQNAASGLVNVVLGWVGLGPLNFPTTGGWRLTLMMIVVMIWIQAGFATVVLSAAIKGVPAEIVEASQIDGATPGPGVPPGRCAADPAHADRRPGHDLDRDAQGVRPHQDLRRGPLRRRHPREPDVHHVSTGAAGHCRRAAR